MKRFVLTAAILLACAAPAYAGPTGITSGCLGAFCIEGEDGDEIKMFNDVANKDVPSFFGSTHGNGSKQFTDDFTITTVGNVDTGSGYANIKPIKDGTLTDIKYTVNNPAPANPGAKDQTPVVKAYDGFFTRGQVEGDTGTATVELLINGTLKFDFSVPANSPDFTTIGVDEPASGPGSAGTQITSVEMYLVNSGDDTFKEVKQTDWSPCGNLAGDCGTPGINPTGTVPEPSTWAMIISGFGLMGWLGWRKRTARYAVT